MKLFKNIKILSGVLLLSGSLMTSCNFLDIVPPEQAGMSDATQDADHTLGFLYSCYGGLINPLYYYKIEASADEYAQPQLWGWYASLKVAYDQMVPQNNSDSRWDELYKYIGQTNLFLRELPNAKGITEEQREQWEAEAYFLLAYYHFEVLRTYGPCPITDSYVPSNTTDGEFKGRMHYDAVTNWIVDILDNKVLRGYKLPSVYDAAERGRATNLIALVLKSRALLYAASPLWNGSFPFPDWRNKVKSSYGGVDYGTELVSKTYDPQKWERARIACEAALREAQNTGHVLYNDKEFYSNEKVSLSNVYIPGNNDDDDFKKTVLMLRYMSCLRYDEGNTEFIWGLNPLTDDNFVHCSLPNRVMQESNGNWWSGWSGLSPFLNTIDRFYMADGKRLDKTRVDWLQRAGLSDRADIVNLHVGREPRFYAWMVYDQGDYGTMVADGQPLTVDFKNNQKQGLNPNLFNRNHSVTGYLNQKFVRPNWTHNKSGGMNTEKYQRPLMRVAELYLNLAECYAMQDKQAEALNYLNPVHQRAGLPAITAADITAEYDLMEWIRNERFLELWGEGFRYFDVRRWVKGPEYLSAGKREGLNAEAKENPTFEEFNQRIKVNQPYKWTNRQYVLPIAYGEIAKNQQLVQAPGY